MYRSVQKKKHIYLSAQKHQENLQASNFKKQDLKKFEGISTDFVLEVIKDGKKTRQKHTFNTRGQNYIIMCNYIINVKVCKHFSHSLAGNIPSTN